MILKKFNVFGISASWPFWLVDAIVAAAVGRAIYYNYWVTHTGLGVGLPILLTVLGVFLLITGIFYLSRWAFSKTIDGQTSQGTFVIISDKVKENIKNGLLVHFVQTFEYVIDNIGKEIDSVKKFWLDWYNSADGLEYQHKNNINRLSPEQAKAKLDDIFNGGFVIINPEPMIQQSSLGPMAWLTMPAMGLQKGNQAAVVWDPDINPGITNLRDIVGHETGHMALESLGIPSGDNGNLHHEIFKNSNYGA